MKELNESTVGSWGPNGGTEGGKGAELGWTKVVARSRKKKPGQPPRPSEKEIWGELDSGRRPGRIVCWARGSSRSVMWERVSKACGMVIVKAVLKISRVTRSETGDTKFILTCCKEEIPTIMARMTEFRSRWGWSLKAYDARLLQRQRKAKTATNRITPPRKAQEPAPLRKWLRVGTLNVNGCGKKRTEVRNLLETQHFMCLGIQETLIKPTDPTLKFPGYQCLNVCATQTESERGVSLVIHKRCKVTPIRPTSPFMISARIAGGGLQSPMVVASVYIPGQGLGKPALKKVSTQIAGIREKYPDDPIMTVGDWNRTSRQVQSEIQKGSEGFEVLTPRNDGRGTRKHKSGRVIDHLAAFKAASLRTRRVEVRRDVDISDHYPVVADVATIPRTERVESLPGKMPTEVIRVRHVVGREGPKAVRYRDACSRIALSNKWEPLVDAIEDANDESGEAKDQQDSADALAQLWATVSKKVAKANGMIRRSGGGRVGRLPKKIARTIAKRGRCFQRMNQCRGDATATKDAKEAYLQAKSEARNMVKAFDRESLTKRMTEMCLRMKSDPKGFWEWAATKGGWRPKQSGGGGSQPVKDPDTGKVLSGETEIAAAWQTHYGRLARDITGNSRAKAKWTNWEQRPQRRELTQVNTAITMEEVREAVERMKRHKAAGSDQVPADFLKAMCMEEESIMGQAILELVQFMWEKGTVPKEWATSSVVSIPKKGDLSDMNNYRGISLIVTILKLLISVISNRIDRAFEAEKLYSRAQAGFRRREECITQVACLHEICKRRKLDSKRTLAMFVDLKKAYDTVPHEALFAKLDFWGIRGKALAFIRALYAGSSIAVRTEMGTGDSEPLLRGVRQGCPMSPILFSIFINDILDGMGECGVEVPGVPNTRIPGLLFADDLVVMAPNSEKLTEMSDVLSSWTKYNEMEVGIKKCGVMIIEPSKEGVAEENEEEWHINGEQVPRVKEYRYLGVNFRDDLDLEQIVPERVVKTQRLLATMLPFLRSRKVPLPMRIMVLKGVVVPTMTAGAELVTMRLRAAAPLQDLLNQVMRQMLQFKHKDRSVSVAAMWREFGVPPLIATMYAARARAYVKCRSLRTWASKVIPTPTNVKGRTWASATRDWMNTRAHHVINGLEGEGPPMKKGDWEKHVPHVLAQSLKAALWVQSDRKQISASGAVYLRSRYKSRSLRSINTMGDYKYTRGIPWIIRVRLDAIYTADKMAARGKIPTKYQDICPFCQGTEPETLGHLIVDCPRWGDERTELGLGKLMEPIKRSLGHCEKDEIRKSVVIALAGGQSRSMRLSRWMSRRIVDQPDPKGRLHAPSQCQIFGQFLNVVMKRRTKILSELS